jgi:hypothetical protein
VTQHLAMLEAANLLTTVRRGREKLHFPNPVPLQEIYERWIAKFEKPRLKARRYGVDFTFKFLTVTRGIALLIGIGLDQLIEKRPSFVD